MWIDRAGIGLWCAAIVLAFVVFLLLYVPVCLLDDPPGLPETGACAAVDE